MVGFGPLFFRPARIFRLTSPRSHICNDSPVFTPASLLVQRQRRPRTQLAANLSHSEAAVFASTAYTLSTSAGPVRQLENAARTAGVPP